MAISEYVVSNPYFAHVSTMQPHVTIQRCNVLEATIAHVAFHRLWFTKHSHN